MRIAVLRNPASSRNRGREAPAVPAGVRLVEPGLEALAATLAALAAEGIDVLVVDGGDGTVREVVSRLDAFGDRWPALGIMAQGNTNLVARKLGRVRGYDALAALEEAGEAPVLRADGLPGGPVRGFICGWGAYATGTRIAVEEISARGGGQVMRAILATVRRALSGAEGRAIRAGIDARVAPEGHAAHPGRRVIGIATVLEGGLLPMVRPFWGGGAGPIRWLDVAAPARRLALAAPLAMLGRPMRWMTRAGYRSGRAPALDLTLTGGIVIDGELFEARPGTELRLTAQERIRFVRG